MKPQSVIYESDGTLIYSRKDDQHGQVLVKVLKTDEPTQRQLAHHHNEFEIGQNLELPGIRRVFSRERRDGYLTLVMEYFVGQTVRNQFHDQPADLQQFLDVALKIARTTAALHQAGFVHRDLGANNILYHPPSGEIRIIDFELTRPLENGQAHDPESRSVRTEGTLAYISPEQTGRTNREEDARTDLYSLGVTFYEMLTGQLPFEHEDPSELVHAHLALMPGDPNALREAAGKPPVPAVVTDIVMKLLEKDPGDRYQEARHLAADLECCLEQLEETGDIQPFALDQERGDETFHLPETLLEREKELAKLRETFELVARGGLALTLIKGYEGVGKTSLVREVQRQIVDHGVFIEGRFDQHQQNIPYYAGIQALTGFVDQILTQSSSQLEKWKRRMLSAVGQNGRVLTDVIPNLSLIIGEQPDLAEVGAMEALNRFTYVFQQFLRTIATPDDPLVLFFDDCQWIDPASVDLLEGVMSDNNNQYLWVIAAYRPDEMPELVESGIQRLHEDSPAQYEALTLGNLSLHGVEQIVNQSLEMGEAESAQLAQLVFNKTQGNPFFVRQVLLTLHEQQLIHYEAAEEGWVWNREEVQQLNITENVVELMAAKIKNLPQSTCQVLQLAASVGTRFDLDTLRRLDTNTLLDTRDALAPALAEGLIVSLSDEAHFRFTHERVRQAVYGMIDEEEARRIHLEIAHYWSKKYEEEQRSEHIFDLANQWNAAAEILESRDDRRTLAEINLEAGRKAISSAAYEVALEYLRNGIDMIASYGWENNYSLNLPLHTLAAEAAFLADDDLIMESMIRKIFERGVSISDKLRAYEISMQARIARNDLEGVIQTCRKVLHQMGIDLPEKVKPFTLPWRYLQLRVRLRNRRPADLAEMAEMTDEHALAAMRVFNHMSTAVSILQPEFTPVLVIEQLKLILTHGLSPLAGATFVGYGALLALGRGKLEEGLEWGDAGMQILKRFGDQESLTQTYYNYYSILWPIRHPIREALPPLMEGFRLGMETGDMNGANFCLSRHLTYSYLLGEDLKRLTDKTNRIVNAMPVKQQQVFNPFANFARQITENLSKPNQNPQILAGEWFDEGKAIYDYKRNNNKGSLLSLYEIKMQIAFLFEKYRDGLAYAYEAEKLTETQIRLRINPFYIWYHSLLRLAVYPEATRREKKALMKEVDEWQEILKHWADLSPVNFLQKYYLVEAEKLRVTGENQSARTFYDRAIDLAREHDFLIDEAISWELTGKYYRDTGNRFLAETFLQKSLHAYVRWGSQGKVHFLGQRYPLYLGKHLRSAGIKPKSRSGSSGSTDSLTGLDLESMVKASQALSGEIVLSNLLEKMLHVVMENAGAERVVFIDTSEGQLQILAEGDSRKGITVIDPVNLDQRRDLSRSIVNYVARTGKVLVLDHATSDPSYRNDNYLQANETKSLLCFPISHKGQKRAVLYLENNLIEGAFTADRLELLSLLSSQIAISIENARLYESLDEKVRARTAQLDRKNSELAATLDKLQSTQSQLVQSEKMASLGQLTAGIAHEINNPINYISGNISPLSRDISEIKELLDLALRLSQEDDLEAAAKRWNERWQELDGDFLIEEIQMLLAGIREGTQRTKTIVAGLKNFSRLDESEFKMANIHDALDSTLTLLHNKLKNRIEVHKDYGNLPEIECLPGKLNQVLMNILNNAAQAIDKKGDIWIKTWVDGTHASISIRDSGQGMKEEVRNRIFEPFFTTKDVGIGTGLGLSISYGIIEQHHGRITVESELGKGSNFIITLPLRQPVEEDQALKD